jgi:hypothetical protein
VGVSSKIWGETQNILWESQNQRAKTRRKQVRNHE